MGKIRIAGIVNDSIVDGPGIRLAVFTQGCAITAPVVIIRKRMIFLKAMMKISIKSSKWLYKIHY